MGKSGEGKNTAHQTKKLIDDDVKAFRDRFNIPIADDQLADIPFYKPADDTPEMRYLHEHRKALGGYLPQRRARADETARRAAARDLQGRARADRRRPRDLDHAGLRALPDAAAARQGARPARGADPRRRGAHLRHGRPVPPDRHLQPRGPELHAGRQGPGDVLPRGQGRPGAAGGHQRGRRHEQLDRRGDLVLDEQPHHGAVLRVLLDVRLPARRRPRLGGRRHAGARLPARRHLGPHHAQRRRPAARGRAQPHPGRHDPELHQLRPDASRTRWA